MVVNDHFIREGHLWQLSPEPGQLRHTTFNYTTFNYMKSDIQIQLNKNISLL